MTQQDIGKTKQEIDERFIPINFTYTVALPNGRQVTASTSFYPLEGADPNAVLDSMSKALERQRAMAEIAEFDEEIEKHVESMEKGEADIAALSASTDNQIEALRKKHSEAGAKYQTTHAELKAETEAEGSRRTFDEEKPGVKSKLQPYLNEQKVIIGDIEKLNTERENGIKNFRANMAHFEAAVVKLKKKREIRVKLVG